MEGHGTRRITHVELLDWNGKARQGKVTVGQGNYYEAVLEDRTLIATDKDGGWFVVDSSPSPDKGDLELTETKAW